MLQKIKKSLLITLDFPPNYGGVSTYYYNICNNLPSDKIVTVAPVYDQQLPETEKFDRQQKFTIIRKNLASQKSRSKLLKIFNTWQWASSISYLEKIIKNHQIELIQVGQILPLGTIALALKLKHGLPYVVYAHGLDIMLAQNVYRKKKLIRKILAKADGVITNSNFTKDEVTKLGVNPEKITVVYPCPNLKPEQVSAVVKQELIDRYELRGKRVILTVGRLVERKGHDMVIKALPAIIKKIPTAIYLIAGQGPHQQILKNLLEQNRLGNHVWFIDSVSNQQLAALYEISEVVVMPSRRLSNGDVEGFGITFLEANVFGKPVIGGRSGGIPEAILDNRTGILVDPTSQDQIADAIIKLLLDQALAERLGLQGLDRVSEFFDWRVQTEKIEHILK